MENIRRLLLLFGLCGLLLASASTWAQPIRWPDSPDRTFVYQLTNKEAHKLLKGDLSKKRMDKILRSPFTSFTGEWEGKPLKGHFVYANIIKNQVQYAYHPVVPFQVFLFKEYGLLTLQVVDAGGTVRKDAKVRVDHKRVSFDADSQTYTHEDWSEQEDHLLTVELDQFRAVFDLRKHLVMMRRSDWGNDDDDEPQFYSYLITDKNKYKPGETVRFKSYALSPSKRPIKDDLTLYLQEAGGYRFRKLKSVAPYHPGGFADEFCLVDSLKLLLDKSYSMQLRDRKGRIVSETRFKYEDYVLTGKKLRVEGLSATQYAPQVNRMEITATDANGLMLQETDVEVTVRLTNVLQSYAPVLQLNDTLMYKRVRLGTDAPTVVEISADIFGPSDAMYSVEVLVLPFDGERMEQRFAATYFHSKFRVDSEVRNDSIRFVFYEGGEERSVGAQLVCNGLGQDIRQVRLPHTEKINPALAGYEVKVPRPEVSNYFPLSAIPNDLELTGGIEKDSLIIGLKNPLQLDIAWYMYEGNRLLQKGFGKEIDFRHGEVLPKTVYYAELFYSIGGEEQVLKKNYWVKPGNLTIETDLPKRIYPGQQVNATLTVSNAEGRPVPAVDLTAFAVNTQLQYYIPDLPDYTQAPQGREQRASYSMRKKNYLYARPLDYAYWNQWAGLDAMSYYQFTYPAAGTMFKHTVNTPDGTTQFAPFVMKDGKAVGIYVIEVDDVPVYFSWAEQPRGYSFLVSNALQYHKITLRLSDQAIIFDQLPFEKGKKTLFSVNLDRLPREAYVLPLPYTDRAGRSIFSSAEMKRYSTYICRMPVPANADYTVLDKDGTIYPVYLAGQVRHIRNGVVVGPVAPGYMRYANRVRYRHEGGYSYQFEGNVVYKYSTTDLFPTYLSFSSDTKFNQLNDFHLTRPLFDSVVAAYRKGRAWHPTRIYLNQVGKRLNFCLPVEKDSTGVANLLLENRATGKMLFPDSTIQGRREFISIPDGMYNAILLYNNGKYLRTDSLPVLSNTWLDVDMRQAVVHPCDSLSMEWLCTVMNNNPIGPNQPPPQWITQVRRAFGNKVCGYVYDSEGIPMTGCCVLVKGTTEGTIADIDGYFEIYPTNRQAILEFSFIGYQRKEMLVTHGMDLSVVMEDDCQMLEEVVVVGYGTARRSELTGAVMGVMVSSAAAETVTPTEPLDEEADKAAAQEAEKQLYNELLQLNGLRRNFSDVGFWQPRLYTDKAGKAEFNVTFPDNITKWETVVYAMNRKLKTGTYRQSIQSYKPLMAELFTPQFLVAGDTCQLAGTIRNYTDDKAIRGKAMFSIGTDTIMNSEVTFEGGYNEKLTVHPTVGDSITASYLFTRDDGYRDGEERTLPVLPQGTEIEKGTLGILQVGKPVCIEAAADEVTHVTLTSCPLNIFMESADYLFRYQYLCNEQMASKLLGLLAQKQYAHFKGEKFRYDKQTNDLIRRLCNNRNNGRLWSWWGRSEQSSYWISGHVLRALKAAKEAGYTVDLDGSKLKSDFVRLIPYTGAGIEKVEILHALSEWGAEVDYAAGVRMLQTTVRQREQVEDSLARVSAIRHKALGGNSYLYQPVSYLKEKLLLWDIQQKQNLAQVADSIRPYLRKDVLGGVYVDDDRRQSYWYSGKLFNTLIAYEIVKRDSALSDLKEAMQLYIVQTKQYGWNTYQASMAVSTILPDLLTEANTKENPATILLSGKENGTRTAFPYQTVLSPGEQLTLEKKDGVPMLYSAYTVKRMKEAQAGEAFEVETSLSAKTLAAGVPVTLTVTVQVKQEGAEHVMIEVPIPAGCEYDGKPMYWNKEVHREYFKEKTAIFCEKLPVGEHKFQIKLLPRYTGTYTVNPAKVGMMYFPVINANNDMRMLPIMERRIKE